MRKTSARSEIKMTAVAPALVAAPFAPAVLTEDRVIVVQKESWGLAPRGRLANLLLDPAQARTGRNIDEHDAARCDLHYYEDVHDREQRRVALMRSQ